MDIIAQGDQMADMGRRFSYSLLSSILAAYALRLVCARLLQ